MPPSGEAIAARYLFLGADRRVAFVDRSIEQLWGVTARMLRGEPALWLDRIHPDDREQLADALEGPSGSSWTLEYRVRREDGSEVWVQDSGRTLNSGRSRQTSGRVVDITVQRRLEERLRFQGQLLEAVGEAVIACDRDGVVTSWNPAASRMFGWRAKEAIGRRIVEIAFMPAERAEVARLLHRIAGNGQPWTGELRLWRREGFEVPGHVTLAPLFDGYDEVAGVVALAFDVSDLRAARSRVEASEKDQRRLVEQLRRLTAHLHVVREQEQRRIAREVHDELGQILTGLKLDVSWLRRRAASGNGHLSDVQLRERLGGIAQLVEQTLDAARHIARQLRPPALDDLGLEAAIEWLAEEFRSRTGVGCEVRTELAGLPVPGPQDTAAYRIVQEALTNVARHAEAGRVSVSVRHQEDSLVIDIVDDGKGVPREALRAAGSLGILGMRERARARGGELSVRRLPRGGTRVHARLPLTSPHATAAADAASMELAEREAAP